MWRHKALLSFIYCYFGIITSVKTTEDLDTPQFEHGSYGYFIKVDVKGLIGIVEATVETPEAGLIYSFETENEILRDSLKPNPEVGIIDLGEYLPPALYEGIMYATNNITGSIGSAVVVITVELEENCPVDKITTVKKTLIVRELREEEAHTNIYPSIVGDCHYRIEQQLPVNTSFFYIDDKQKMIKSTKFDRESPIFDNMTIPQFRVVLKLICPNASTYPHDNFNYSYVILHDIDYSMDTTILSVIIEDINDNPPKFVEPESDIIIGYPSSEVAQKILPDHLFQVHATDADVGLNAKISYKLDTNSHFTIDRENGVIAPLPQAMHDVNVIDITVRAFDRDGQVEANLAVVKIKVMKLLASNLVSLLYENVEKLSHEEVLEKIRRESMMKLLALKITTVPKVYNDSDVIPLSFDQKTLVNIVGYALNIKTNRPMPHEDIMKILTPLEETINLVVAPYNETFYNETCEPFYGGPKQDIYKILFIIFASMLGSFIVIILVVLILAYTYLVKPFKLQTEVESRSSSRIEQGSDIDIDRPVRAKTTHRKFQKSGDKRVSFGTSRRLNDMMPDFDSEDDRRTSWSESVSSESDHQRRETQNMQFQEFMKKFDRIEGDGSDANGLDVLEEEKY